MGQVSLKKYSTFLSDNDDGVQAWVQQSLDAIPSVQRCLVEVVHYPTDFGVSMHALLVPGQRDVTARGEGMTLEVALARALEDLAERVRNARLGIATLRMRAVG